MCCAVFLLVCVLVSSSCASVGLLFLGSSLKVAVNSAVLGLLAGLRLEHLSLEAFKMDLTSIRNAKAAEACLQLSNETQSLNVSELRDCYPQSAFQTVNLQQDYPATQ